MESAKFNKLIHRFKGDIKSFDQIYKYYFPRITIYINRKYYNYHIGEDIAQDFFVKLFDIQIPDKIEYPTLWVFKICDNLAKTFLKSSKNNITLPLEEDYCQIEDIDSNISHLQNGGISKENIDALKNLDALTLEIFVMYFWEGYNYKEIAIKLNMSHESVRQKASRGLKKLKNLLINCHTLMFIISLLR